MKKQAILILGIMLAGTGALHAMSAIEYEKWEQNVIRKNSVTLLKAIKSGDFQEAKALINSGAVDVNVKDREMFSLGCTPLMLAAREGNPKLVRMLINARADVNAIVEDNGATALLFAAGKGHREITDILITSGANVNMLFEGKTILFYAIKNGHQECALMLIHAMLKLTKEQKDSVYALIASLECTPELQTNQNTRRLIAQELIDAYKKENRAKTRAEIEKVENGELKNQLLQLLEKQ